MGAFLSDAFQHSNKSGRFEWTAQMININEGRKEGRLSTLMELVADGSMSISKAAEKRC